MRFSMLNRRHPSIYLDTSLDGGTLGPFWYTAFQSLMATTKPRIQVTLNENTYATIKRLAKLQGQSMSKVVGDVMESIHPPLMRTVALIDAANDAPDKVKTDLVRAAETLEKELSHAVGSSLAQMDLLIHGLDAPPQEHRKDGAPGASSDAPTGRQSRHDPPLVTRGSHRDYPPSKTSSKGPRA